MEKLPTNLKTSQGGDQYQKGVIQHWPAWGEVGSGHRSKATKFAALWTLPSSTSEAEP